jgi:hypothetical protein
VSIVERPDLSQRKGLSKSLITDAEQCEQRWWLQKWHPVPWRGNPDTEFGRCLDAGIQLIVEYARAGTPLDIDRAKAAAEEMESPVDGELTVDQDEVGVGLELFVTDVLPHFDWAYCQTQAHINVPMFNWGKGDGHPDLILSSGAVWDVKSGRKARSAKTLELAYYAFQMEASTGEMVPEVGYLMFVRAKEPYWQGFGRDELHQRELKSGPNKGQLVTAGHPIPNYYPDKDFLDWAYNRISAMIRADKADTMINRVARENYIRQHGNDVGWQPENDCFPGGPRNGGLCRGCRFNPLYGGTCVMAVSEEEEE